VKTLTGFVSDVRRLVQDQEAIRYADFDILDTLDTALAEVSRLRPDIAALYDVAPANEWLSDDEIPVGPEAYAAILAFSAGWLQLGSAPTGGDNDSTAIGLIQRLTTSLTT